MAAPDALDRLGSGLASPRLLAALILAGGFLLLAAPPLLPRLAGGPGLAAAIGIRAAWSPFCHQMIQRTPVATGIPLPLCLRCTALVTGAMLGTAAALLCPGTGHPRRRRLAALTAAALLVADVLAQTAGLYGTDGTRVLTGLVLGAVLLHALVLALPGKVGSSWTDTR